MHIRYRRIPIRSAKQMKHETRYPRPTRDGVAWLTPRARVRRARLAPVARNHRRTRHACRQTSGDDRPLGIVTLEPVNDRKIGHPPARAVICSGIVAFTFLGFVLICDKTRRGDFRVRRKSRGDRMKTKLREIKEALRQRTNRSIPETGKWLAQVVAGYFAYHAVPTNGLALSHSDIMSSSSGIGSCADAVSERDGVVTFAHFTCRPSYALKDGTKENQSFRALDVGVESAENGLFLANVTMPFGLAMPLPFAHVFGDVDRSTPAGPTYPQPATEPKTPALRPRPACESRGSADRGDADADAESNSPRQSLWKPPGPLTAYER